MNPEAPDADVQEQRREVVARQQPAEPPLEASEADAHEQQREVVPHEPVETAETPLEANEADAHEQRQEVPVDDEDEV
ncbi:hypothetical protein [Lentzea sp. E54]|uniref:hypothetical protein n=1 Tax=Lentzea xerophila TaxID=3435883 RepID=UPI003DA4F7DC